MFVGALFAVVCGVCCDFYVYGAFSYVMFFFFQAEDGIRDLVRSRGLGDVYKRQSFNLCVPNITFVAIFK
mgnify:CR=1 FL=1